MVRKNNWLTIVGKGLIVAFLFIEIYPIFWIMMSSVKSNNEFALSPSYALPQGLYWQNYVEAWNRGRMNIYFMNSAIVTVVSLVLIVILSTTSALR
jgi:raffinose/stachyose/melibiose transport system permease protein